MHSTMNLSRLVAVTLLAASTLVGAAACGDEPLKSNDTGTPPDGSAFDPGKGGGGSSGYGYGSSSGGPSAPECPDELKKCAVTFTYPFNGESSVELRGDYRGPESWLSGDPLLRSGSDWVVTVPVAPGQPVLYKFCIDGCTTSDKWVADPDPAIARVDDGQGTGGQNSKRTDTTCTETVCDEPPLPPPGVFDWRDSVMYFVFVDRFHNGNPANDCNVAGVTDGNDSPGNYQGGDWAGVTQKIEAGYFTELGVNTLWLTVPVDNTNQSGKGAAPDNNDYSAYHGYWPANLDPESPESCFGTSADLQALVDAAHAKNIKILFDYAMVHVHASSPVWTEHPDWFWSLNYGNSNHCVCGDGCSWDTDFKRCWFTDYLPHWNYSNVDARNYSVNNAVAWAKKYGIDGFRLDAIKHIEDSWLTDLRAKISAEIVPLQDPPQRFYMVGETFDWDNQAYLRSFVEPATKLDGQFDFPARKAIVEKVLMRNGSMSELASFYDQNDYFYGVNAVMSPFLGNHDIGRVIHMAEDTPRWNIYSEGDKADGWSATQPPQPSGASAYERLGVAFAVLLTNRGAPLIYYGDEIGLAGAGDPGNRKFMPWSGVPATQEALRSKVKALTSARAAHPSLRRGRRTTLDVHGDVWLYRMSTSGDEVYVLINRGDESGTTEALPAGNYTELLAGGNAAGGALSVPARSARLYVKQ